VQIIHAGQVGYEPTGAIIEHFDNASDSAPAKFIFTTCSTGKKS
jgi:hypothetical protein